MFPRARLATLALSLAAAPIAATGAGVPSVDIKQIGQWLLQKQQDLAQRAAETGENARRDKISQRQQDQLAALDQTLQRITGSSRFLPELEAGSGATDGIAATEVYAIEDDNPYAARLFGDAPATIEEMIAETSVKYANHPALARAGINAVEFRCWFQGLVKQESNFSIGARSPVAAFGLTQIMPGTAKDLGIYPAYYDDPRVQLDLSLIHI